ncbi:hypothetical protein D0865_02097 [Hortaea werneckii]|uniref:Cupin type-2 domain-containing protein n=1 Tax=Hortaea werneckii TaxID=91943 RepID=A0A3M7D4Z5_HORWE|nr:hypothetical protein D0865_02097 [Hortaea werneckii]
MSLLPVHLAAACIHYNKPTMVTEKERNAQPVDSFAPDSGFGDITWKTLISAPDTPTYNLTAGYATCDPGDSCLAPHTHEPPEIYFLTKGKARMTIGSKERDVAAGDTIFIPGNVTHGIRVPANNESVTFGTMEWFYVYAVDGFSEVEYVKQ